VLLDDGTGGLVFPNNLATEMEGPVKRAKVRLAVTKAHRAGTPARITNDWLDSVLAQETLPSPAEQGENAILLVGDETINDPGTYYRANTGKYAAHMGAVNTPAVIYVLDELEKRDLLQKRQESGEYASRLTFSGWQKYEELRRGLTDSRRAFMAMPFGGEYARLIMQAYEAFKLAVEHTGFKLLNPLLDEEQAGLIDDRLRVEIRESRFLVAELTGNNHNVYFEAGLAEGMGKEVIYTCDEAYFNDSGTRRFDTAHLTTVLWTREDLEEASERLKAVIRNTFPSEAKMTDA